MTPKEIIDLAISLGVLVVSVTIGITGAFKNAFPKANPLVCSIPAGVVLTALSWFATRQIPQGVAGWSTFVIVLLIGGLLPSGLFDAGVNLLQKARRV